MSSLPVPPEPAQSRLSQTLRFIKDPYAFLAQARAECGEIFTVRPLGLGRWVILCRAEHLVELYKLPEDQVLAGEIRKQTLGYLFGPHASISLDGEEYTRRRRVVTPFFAGRRVFRHAGLIRRLLEDRIAAWPTDRSFALQGHFNRIALETTVRILLGPLDQEPAARILPLAWRFFEALQPPAVQFKPLQWNLGRLTAYGRFVAARQALLGALEAEIRSRQDRDASGPQEAPDDVLSALIAADLYDDPTRCRKAIGQEIIAFVVGGAETTAKVLSWTLLGVLGDADILRRLRREIDEQLGDRPIEHGDLRQLPYLHAVVQEGMRYQTVGPFAGPRIAKKDITIGGYSIPAGTAIGQSLQEAGRSEFFPNPEEFDPENFLHRKYKARDWVPFGGGSRICTGMGLAQLELAVWVATIIQRLDLELGSGSTRPTKSGVAFQPANGLRVTIRSKRLPSSTPAAN